MELSPMDLFGPAVPLAVLPAALAARSRLTSSPGRIISSAVCVLVLALGAFYFIVPHAHQWQWFLNEPDYYSRAFNALLGLIWSIGGILLYRSSTPPRKRDLDARA